MKNVANREETESTMLARVRLQVESRTAATAGKGVGQRVRRDESVRESERGDTEVKFARLELTPAIVETCEGPSRGNWAWRTPNLKRRDLVHVQIFPRVLLQFKLVHTKLFQRRTKLLIDQRLKLFELLVSLNV